MGIVDMVLNPTLSIEDTMTAVQEKLSRTENHEGVWAALDATQKALVRMLAKDRSLKSFSNATFIELRKTIGINSLKTTHIPLAIQDHNFGDGLTGCDARRKPQRYLRYRADLQRRSAPVKPCQKL